MTALLELEDVTKAFGGGLFGGARTVALDRVTLSIGGERPSIVAIAGESGSGKTTLARLLLGVVAPSRGRIRYQGQDLRTLTRPARRAFRREVQPIFQDPFEAYNPSYKVDHVLATPVRRFRLATSRREARELIRAAVERVGLRPDEVLGRFPHELSGGQRQRLMVARAFLIRPRVLLADEPVSMVDASLRATILEGLRALQRELGLCLVYITHDLTTAYQISDQIVVLYRGSIVEQGAVDLVIPDPRHPYTRLLVDSIPRLDPDRSWPEGSDSVALDGEDRVPTGCKFAARCPAVMARCRVEPPPLYRVDGRAARCFLYEASPALPTGQVSFG